MSETVKISQMEVIDAASGEMMFEVSIKKNHVWHTRSVSADQLKEWLGCDPAIAVDAAARAIEAADRAEDAESRVEQNAAQIAADAAQQAAQDVVDAVDGAVDRAESEADRAEAAAEQAAAAGRVYESSAAGQADVNLSEGDYFFVVSADINEMLELWQKGASTPTDTGKRTFNAGAVLKTQNQSWSV